MKIGNTSRTSEKQEDQEENGFREKDITGSCDLASISDSGDVALD